MCFPEPRAAYDCRLETKTFRRLGCAITAPISKTRVSKAEEVMVSGIYKWLGEWSDLVIWIFLMSGEYAGLDGLVGFRFFF